MLNSLYIKNYRNLKELKIDAVGQVNLITGKNNTGKTSLLEAIAIYASNASLEYLCKMIENRGEKITQNRIESAFAFFASIFINRVADTSGKYSIVIGEKSNKQIRIQFAAYFDETINDEQGERRKRKLLNDNNLEQYPEYKTALMINSDIIPLDSFSSSMPLSYQPNRAREAKAVSPFEFISTGNIDKEINGKLFDNIALSEQEYYVIEALKIIEPDIEGIAFIDENENVSAFVGKRNELRSRNAVVKLKGKSARLPIKSMGDGINRILTIILALVNSANGFLLIDEFENGLHYTIQEQLWKIIFRLAKDLNVQVFATTHSNDCIHSFEKILNNPENQVSGKLIRLDNVNGVIHPEIILSDVLKIVTEQHIEIR